MKRKPLIKIKAIPMRVTPLAAAIATALGSFSGVSLAADQDVQAKPGTQEIVVSATRRDTSVQEVPYNLSAISGTEIDSLNIVDLSGIARWTPGLVQVDQGSRDANTLIIRGINASGMEAPEKNANTTGGRVSTYYGETPVYIDLAPIDLNRVEVLRGPQGTLYGARSMGGSLRYIPNAPVLNESSIDLHGQSYFMDESDDIGYNGDIVINTPLIEDTLALRAVLGYMKRPGFIDQNYVVKNPGVSCPDPNQTLTGPGNCVEDGFKKKEDVNDEETTSLRLSLLWNISENWDGQLNFQYQDQDTGGRQMNSRNVGDSMNLDVGKYESLMRFEEDKDRENRIYNATFTRKGDYFDFVSSTSYTDYSDDGQRDQTDILYVVSDEFSLGYEDFPAFAAYTDDERDNEIFTQEFRLVSNNTDSKWDWIAGAYYSDGDFDYQSTEYAPELDVFLFGPPSLTDVEAIINTSQTSKELALFGELGYQLTDKLHILGGMRWFDLDNDNEFCMEFPIYDTGQSCEKDDGDDNDFLFKFSASYQLNSELMGYALYSEGYSEGGVNIGNNLSSSERFIKPESVDNYEIGLRSTFLDGSVTLNGALFYMDWDDLQLDSTSKDGFNIVGNGGGAETKGLEIDATWLIGQHWITQIGYAYTEAELTDGCSGSDFTDPGKSCPLAFEETEDGDRLPGTPKNQGNFLLGYQTILENGWNLSTSYRLVSQSDVLTQLGDGDNCCRAGGEKLGGFTTHHANISINDGPWTVSLFADNFTNKYAETGVRDTANTVGDTYGAPGFEYRRYGKFMITPRTIGLDLRYSFGE
jgi:iron complex outermembrane receptor protein